MPVNYFIGWNSKDLEAALRTAQADLAAGKNISMAASGDVRKEERIEKSIEARIKLIYQALNLIDPVTYPNNLITGLGATRIIFSAPPPPNDVNPDFPSSV